ncbi:MAG: hypothetical protein VX699_08060 [Myxococcota bacterium]|nr:hypothetical protein [Myxococcota bacterium]
MRLKLSAISVICILLFLANCKSCVKAEPDTLLKLAPVSTSHLVWIPNGVTLVSSARDFISQATRRGGAAVVNRLRSGTSKQLGVDVLDADSLSERGVQPEKGGLLFLEGASSEPLWACAVSDTKKFDAFIAELMTRVDGANRVSEIQEDGVVIQSVGRPFGNATIPVMVWSHVRGFVLLARPEGMDALKRATKRILAVDYSRPGSSITDDPVFTRLKSRVSEGEFVVFSRGGGSPALEGVSEGLMMSGRLGLSGASLDAFVDLKVPGLKEAFGKEPTLPLAERIEPDALLSFLTRVARPEGLKAVRNNKPLGVALDSVFGSMGAMTALNVEEEVVPLLSGPLTATLHLSNLSRLPADLLQKRHALMQSLSALLDVFHVVITADVADREGMKSLLAKSQAQLVKRGTPIRALTEVIGGKEVLIYEHDVEAPRLGWALVENRYIYSAGTGRLRQTLEHLLGGKPGLKAGLTKSVGGALAARPSSSVMILRSEALADGAVDLLKGFPGMVQSTGMAALANQFVEVIRTVGDVSVGISGEDQGIRVVVREQLQ